MNQQYTFFTHDNTHFEICEMRNRKKVFNNLTRSMILFLKPNSKTEYYFDPNHNILL